MRLGFRNKVVGLVGHRLAICVWWLLTALGGCTTNPVTGEQELILIPTSAEIELGKENYGPARQLQGGDYIADPGIVTYVREVGARLAAVSDRALPYEFAVVNDSEPNAWAMPGGKIAINRGLLLELNNEAELAAVLGHEIVHAAARHSVKQMQQALMLQGAVSLVATALDSGTDNSDFKSLLAVGAAQVASVLIGQKYSRNAEREADLYGMRYMVRAGYAPEAAVRLQETFVRLSREQGGRGGWFSRLFSSHPPSEKRAEANRALLAELPAGGDWGADRYRQRIAHLVETRSAYEAYDAGRQAFNDGDAGRALQLARKAMAMEPREALFQALAGDALMRLDRPAQALDLYRRASRLNPGYYYPKQRLGLLLARLGRDSEAARVLEQGVALLETAPALYALGRISVRHNRYGAARSYFTKAAQSDSDIGRQAWRDLLRMDLPDRADDYLDASLSVDENGRLVVAVTNRTPLKLTAVRIRMTGPDLVDEGILDGTIDGGGTSRFTSAPGQFTPEQVQQMNVEVLGARLADQ